MTTTTLIRGTRTLASVPGLPTSYRTRARYDWVAVDLALDGACKRGELQWNRLPDVDKLEAVRRLNRERLNDTEIAERIGISKKTVERVRRDNGIPAAVRSGVNSKALVR